MILNENDSHYNKNIEYFFIEGYDEEVKRNFRTRFSIYINNLYSGGIYKKYLKYKKKYLLLKKKIEKNS